MRDVEGVSGIKRINLNGHFDSTVQYRTVLYQNTFIRLLRQPLQVAYMYLMLTLVYLARQVVMISASESYPCVRMKEAGDRR